MLSQYNQDMQNSHNKYDNPNKNKNCTNQDKLNHHMIIDNLKIQNPAIRDNHDIHNKYAIQNNHIIY